MTSIKWTARHQVEALRRTYELAALQCMNPETDVTPGAHQAEALGGSRTETEIDFREALRIWACLSKTRINREVRRVDRLARGEWVRETVLMYGIRFHNKSWYQGGESRASATRLTREMAEHLLGLWGYGDLVPLVRIKRVGRPK